VRLAKCPECDGPVVIARTLLGHDATFDSTVAIEGHWTYDRKAGGVMRRRQKGPGYRAHRCSR